MERVLERDRVKLRSQTNTKTLLSFISFRNIAFARLNRFTERSTKQQYSLEALIQYIDRVVTLTGEKDVW